jgi:hypothetical protein
MAESFVKTFKRDYVEVYGASDPVTVMEQLPKGLTITMIITLIEG